MDALTLARERDEELKELVEPLLRGDDKALLATFAGLLAKGITGSGAVQKLAEHVVARLSESPATRCLRAELATLQGEERERDFVKRVNAGVLSMLTDTLTQSVRVQHALSAELRGDVGAIHARLDALLAALAQPSTDWEPWRPLPENQQDPLALLDWRRRLCPLIGRGETLANLLRWAHEGHRTRALVLCGPGGAGKSRLAAELGESLRAAGFRVANASRRSELPRIANDEPLFAVVDYPEENLQQTKALLAASADYPGRLRLVLVSRRGESFWIRAIDDAGATGLFDFAETDLPLPDLSPAQAARLFAEVDRELAARCGTQAMPRAEAAIAAWVQRQPELHTRPLFITAAAVERALSGRAEPELGQQTVRALVRRERSRLRQQSNAVGLREEVAERLAALSVVTGSLSGERLRALASDPALELELPSAQTVLSQVRKLPGFVDGAYRAPTPDLMAAVLMHEVMQEQSDRVPHWLAHVVPQRADGELVKRLERIAYDLTIVFGPAETSFAAWLTDMVRRDTTLAARFEALASRGQVASAIGPFALAVCELLVSSAEGDDANVVHLNNLSNRLSEAGRGPEALTAIGRAVEILERLGAQDPARYAPDLAAGLTNLSSSLREAGRRADALMQVERAVQLFQRLSEQDAARYEPDLAMSLNNFSNHLSEAGRGADALMQIERAVQLYQWLSEQNAARYEPHLAASLNNFSNRLSSAGRGADALTASEHAVKIRERLSKENAARYEPDLAVSLSNLSRCLDQAGRVDDALTAIERAVEILERLSRENAARHEPELAVSLNNLSRCLGQAGRVDDALTAIERAVEICERLSKQNAARYEPDLAMSLHNLSLRLSEAERWADALTAIERAVEIHERLSKQNAARYKPDLARSREVCDYVMARLRDGG